MRDISYGTDKGGFQLERRQGFRPCALAGDAVGRLRDRRAADDRRRLDAAFDDARHSGGVVAGAGRTDRDSVVPPRSGSERRYGGLRSGDVACRGAFRGTGRDALHLRRYFPARRARVQGEAARAVRHRSRRAALGRIFSGGDGGFPRVGVENGGRDDDGRRIGALPP